MTKITQPKTLSGFMELLPEDQIEFNRIKGIIEKNYVKFGFLPLDTPVIELSEVLLAKTGGDTAKEVYTLTRGENNLCLRYDLTVPLAKYVALNYNNLTFPFKRYQIGKVYRGERPQAGRYREFYQCDIDIIGNEKLSLMYDAEIPAVIYNIFKELNIGKFVIHINNKKLLVGLIEHLNLVEKQDEILRLVDKYYKIGEEKVVATLVDDYQISEDKIEKLLQFMHISGSNETQLEALKNLGIENESFTNGYNELKELCLVNLKEFNIDEEYYNIDLKIVRGLDYYTGSIYETFIVGYENIGSVCSGGRYENLANIYCEKHLPGIGISIGLTRLFYQLKQNNLLKDFNDINKVIVLPMDENCFEKSIFVANELRNAGIVTQVYFEDTKFKNKLGYADKLNYRFAIIIGEDEISNNVFTLKDLVNHTQNSYSLDELLNTLKN